MAKVPLFPDAIDEVNAWLLTLGPHVAERCPELEVGDRCAVWRLAVEHMSLANTRPRLVLMQDFPARSARIELSPTLCLRLPHVEENGTFCHGIQAHGDDISNPKAAVGLVLQRLDEFLTKCLEAGWREAEFQAERLNYWDRWAAMAKRPRAYPASELLLDLAPGGSTIQVLPTISLADGMKAFASSGSEGPDAAARKRGWSVATITRGAALVVQLGDEVPWTPSTWPTSFAALNELVSTQTGEKDHAARWYRATKWPNKAPVFIVFQQGTTGFAWSLIPHSVHRRAEPTLIAVKVTRVDRSWALARGRAQVQMAQRTSKRVVILGTGSLGSAVAELLARAGIGDIELVDTETFEPENTSRHILGMPDLGKSKAEALAARLKKNVPGLDARGAMQSASSWTAALTPTSKPDLVVDCTGERTVRLILSNLRASKLRGVPVVMGWMEPFGAAAHVVILTGEDGWPDSDPTDTRINYATWPESSFVALPACGQGFHEYGVADAWTAAALVVEKTLAQLSSSQPTSGVWSRVRSREFFDSAAPGVILNREIPCPPGLECVVVHRSLEDALNGT